MPIESGISRIGFEFMFSSTKCFLTDSAVKNSAGIILILLKISLTVSSFGQSLMHSGNSVRLFDDKSSSFSYLNFANVAMYSSGLKSRFEILFLLRSSFLSEV